MDDELKAIQADLDQVLDRLNDYLEHEPEECTDERLVALLYLYIFGRKRRDDYDLATAISLNDVQRDTEARLRQCYEADHGERKGKIIAALSSIRHQHSWKGPVSRWAIKALAEPADRYVSKIDRYFGEYAGEDLLRHRAVRPRLQDMQRALFMVFELCRDDPNNNKLSRKSVHHNVFEKVARVTHLGESDIERRWRESWYPYFLRQHRLRIQHGTDLLDEIEGRAPYFDPQTGGLAEGQA